MKTDADLLREFVEQGSQTAFAGLVERHLNLVYSAALRQVGGNAHRAQDATQIVFVDLARKAASLTRHASLVGWLYTSACYAAANLVRTEQRRGARERTASFMHEITAGDDAVAEWERLRPLLDRAMLALNDSEREAVLLRFFTGQSFAEIGAVQSLNENTARKRVERALDKLQRLLVRQGVTSTGAALGLVLSQQAVTAAPAGLASSVSGIALASTAGAGGPALGTFFLTLMTTTKISGIAALAALIALCLSLSFNVFLAVSPARGEPLGATSVKAQVAPQDMTAQPEPVSMAVISRSLIANADLASLRDELRAAGASEDRVREVLHGILRRRYREELSTKRISRIERGWWRDDQRTFGILRQAPGLRDEPGTANAMIDVPLTKLLGPNPGKVALAEARYDFLPPEMRMTFLQTQLDTQLEWVTTGDAAADAKTDAEFAKKAQRARDERDRLLAGLPSEQRQEYEMRYSALGTRLAAQLEVVPGGTEEEFRKVYRFAEESTNQPGGNAMGPDGRGLIRPAQPDQVMMDRFVAALGYDRALDYLWIGTQEYRMTAAVAQAANLPTTTAVHFTQLAAETGAKAAAIHDNPTLTVEQRRAALQELQQVVRPEIDELLTPSAQQKLPAPALAWLGQLAEGRYKVMVPTLPGGPTFSLGGSMLITSSAPPALRAAPLPRRPSSL